MALLIFILFPLIVELFLYLYIKKKKFAWLIFKRHLSRVF